MQKKLTNGSVNCVNSVGENLKDCITFCFVWGKRTIQMRKMYFQCLLNLEKFSTSEFIQSLFVKVPQLLKWEVTLPDLYQACCRNWEVSMASLMLNVWLLSNVMVDV